MNPRHRAARSIGAATSLALLGGCASWTPPLAPTEKPEDRDAYLYGRFGESTEKYFLAFDYKSIGLVFKCEDGASYTVRLRLEDNLQLMRVKPSTCSLQETIYTDADGDIKGRKASPPGVMKDMKLRAGVAYYVGDFYGTVWTAYSRIEWKIDSAKDMYAETTEALKLRYPAFSNLPFEDVVRPRPH